jgi:ABC-type multidrug transport system fused ATPase/permease subunit
MQQDLKGKINRRARFTVISRLLISSSFSLGYIIAFIWGALQLRDGIITFGVMTSFLQLVSQIQQPILQMVNMIPQVIQTSASIDRLNELETIEAEEIQSQNERMEGTLGVSVQNVSFSYALGDRQILCHFSYNFHPGSKTALMGQTGVGKTTLFRLLLALIKPNEGTLSIYNCKEKQYISENTRSNFVFVPQGNTLMSGSIRYNLQLAKPDATEEELQRVLHTAMADFVNDLPEGMDTECGERGSGLSEGQAQRIAIARGLLRPGSILLLDEISSSLDEHTEHELFRQIFEKYPDKTMIFITHRPEVCQLCNEVVNIGQ